jgi:hypothetical protein
MALARGMAGWNRYQISQVSDAPATLFFGGFFAFLRKISSSYSLSTTYNQNRAFSIKVN